MLTFTQKITAVFFFNDKNDVKYILTMRKNSDSYLFATFSIFAKIEPLYFIATRPSVLR